MKDEGKEVENAEYLVHYWDTPDYILMKEGIWCKQIRDQWMLRKLEKDGVSTLDTIADIEDCISSLLGYKSSLPDYVEKSLTKKVEFPGSTTRWVIESCEVQLTCEGDLRTVSVRTEDNLGDGLKNI